MKEPRKGVCIRNAGNVGSPPCSPSARRATGCSSTTTSSAAGHFANPDLRLDYQAECEGGYFSTPLPKELLGLVAMWEVRGDDWRLKPGEAVIEDELHAMARTFDRDGNELPGESMPSHLSLSRTL